MVDTAEGEEIRRQLVSSMAITARPMSTSELQRHLAAERNLYVINETLYQNLVVLAQRGDIVRLAAQGHNARWIINTHPSRGEPSGMSVQPHDCIKLVRTDGILLGMNQVGCAALGLPLDETEFGMVWLELLPEEFRRQGLRALNAARNGKAARFSGVSLGGQNAQRWDNILTPIADEDNQIRTILCVSRDVTSIQQS
ncbi:PAS domain-containing protein [Mycolicibacterium sp. Y3]